MRPEELTLADRWIIARCDATVREATEAYERFRLNEAAAAVYHFLWSDLADWYIEQIKPRLYGDRPGGDVARAVAASTFDVALRLLHPVMPFITETLWQRIPGTAGRRVDRGRALARARPPGRGRRSAAREFGLVQELVGAIRAIRAEYGVQPGPGGARVRAAPGDGRERARSSAERARSVRLAKVSRARLRREHRARSGGHAVLSDGTGGLRAAGRCDRRRPRVRAGSARRSSGSTQLVGVQEKKLGQRAVRRPGAGGRWSRRSGRSSSAGASRPARSPRSGHGSDAREPGRPARPRRPLPAGRHRLRQDRAATRRPARHEAADPGVDHARSRCSVHPGFDGNVDFIFSEVVSEGGSPSQGYGTGDLEKLVLLSPTNKVPVVRWHRSRISVRPREGWRPNTVYRVQLLPGISDIRNNKGVKGGLVTFTTGAPVPDYTLRGIAYDWTASQPMRGGLIEAVLEPDSLVYKGITDSSGAYAFGPLPRGTYLVYVGLDQNRNGKIDPREAYDSVRVEPDSGKVPEIFAFIHDTTPPRLTPPAVQDSVTINLTFTQKLDPYATYDSTAVRVLLLPDSTPIPVLRVMTAAEFDSLSKMRSGTGRLGAEGEGGFAGASRYVAGEARYGEEGEQPDTAEGEAGHDSSGLKPDTPGRSA